VAIDAKGNIHVTNPICQGGVAPITVFAAGSNGDAPPIAILSGDKTQLTEPASIALDAAGNIYIADRYPSETIKEFAAGSNGNVPPIATIVGDKTGISDLDGGIALDSQGNIYVSQKRVPETQILEYAAGGRGNIAPIATIIGAEEGNFIQGLALDSKNNIYAATDRAVREYAAGSNGNVLPIATIEGGFFAGVFGGITTIGLDIRDYIYVFFSNEPTSSVYVFAAGSNGDAAPIAVISGDKTLIGRYGFGIAFNPARLPETKLK